MVVRQVSSDFSEAQLLLEQLRIAARSDGASPRSFALLLPRVSETRAWEGEFPSFRAYLEASEEDDGLGLSETAFFHIAELGGELALAKQLLYGEIKRAGSVGRPKKESGTHNTSAGRDGAAIVARLKRDDPELAEQVVRGELRPYAAARAKGWRRPRIVVSTPERTAKSLRKHMSPEARQALARLLMEED
jgi:hypothetical protein